MELAATSALFGEAQNSPRVFGVKGAIGHTLGAAGGIEIALCAKCLLEGLIPPTVGCDSPESLNIVLEKTPFSGDQILSSNSGFGGTNVAVLLEKLS
jgi:3-oxoacyl-[acyl-carrier-protein] synthase II